MMTLTITDRIIRSLDTRHTASCRPGAAEWQVTWLPGRILTQDQAVAAMESPRRAGNTAADCGPSSTTINGGRAWMPWRPCSACPAAPR